MELACPFYHKLGWLYKHARFTTFTINSPDLYFMNLYFAFV